jgi:succinate dehydrogenase flavin-adding protein (antitoxin of CptAB toxin-antitoxin module)
MISVANKTIQNYMESLNESEKKELVQFLNSDDNELKTNFSSLKESVLTKLETLKESSDSETIGKINETIEKVSSEKYDKLTYFKLKGLKEKL